MRVLVAFLGLPAPPRVDTRAGGVKKGSESLKDTLVHFQEIEAHFQRHAPPCLLDQLRSTEPRYFPPSDDCRSENITSGIF